MDCKLKLCVHMKCLQKKSVRQCVESPPKKVCLLCQQSKQRQQNPLVICLHCNCMFCEGCLDNHQKQHNKHIFTLNVNFFMVVCGECKNDIQWLIDNYEGKQTDEQLMRMYRFVDFLREAWIKLAIHYGIYNKKQEENSVAVGGLVNLGNTCFFNSTLQILSATQKLVNLYINTKFSKSKIHKKLLRKQIELYYNQALEKYENEAWNIVTAKKTRQNIRERKLSPSFIRNNSFNTIFSQFLKQKIQNASQIISPFVMLNKIAQFDKKYSYQEQQDAEELLILILDALSQGEMISLDIDEERYKKIEKVLGQQKLSMIQQIFGSYLASRIICNKCQKQSWTVDFTYHFSVPLGVKAVEFKQQQEKPGPISEIKYYRQVQYPQNKGEPHPLLQPLFQKEKLTKIDNYFNCQSCSSVSAEKKFYILDPPSILVISLKRFAKSKKITSYMSFPQELKIDSLCLISEKEQIPSYFLYGVIVHVGNSVNTGHYISYVKIKSQWFCCSDEDVRKVTWRDVKVKEAYILFYSINSP